MRAIRSLKDFVSSWLLADVPRLFTTQRRVRLDIKQNSDAFEERKETLLSDPRSKVALEVVRAYFQEENERRLRVENKARVNVVGITISFSVILACVGILSNVDLGLIVSGHSCSKLFLLAPLFFGVIFLVLSGLFAFSALGISEIYAMTLGEEALFADSIEKAAYLVFCIELNQSVTRLKSNFVYVSNKCMLNGVVSFTALMIILIARLLFL